MSTNMCCLFVEAAQSVKDIHLNKKVSEIKYLRSKGSEILMHVQLTLR